MDDVLEYAGKRLIVTGAASGIGEATARILIELGAEVHAIDVTRPDLAGLASFTETDLREPEQIDRAVRKIGKIVNGLFNCADLPNTFPAIDVMLVNFLGLRQITESVLASMIPGSSIACIASTAGIGWMQNMELLLGLVTTPDFATARVWCDAHPKELRNAYGLSKEAINLYTAFRSFDLAHDGIRLNCVNPGPTATSMVGEFEQAVGTRYIDDFLVPLGRHAVAEEQAWPMVFLNSPRASFVTGHQLDCDGGFKGGLFTGRIDPSVLMPGGGGEGESSAPRPGE